MSMSRSMGLGIARCRLQCGSWSGEPGVHGAPAGERLVNLPPREDTRVWVFASCSFQSEGGGFMKRYLTLALVVPLILFADTEQQEELTDCEQRIQDNRLWVDMLHPDM